MSRTRALRLARTAALAGVLAAALIPATPTLAADLFVDATNGDDGADGLSWATARATIGSAVATAGASAEADVVSVAEGRYVEQLVVPAGTTLLGGFPAGGGPRDPRANETVLDGARGIAPIVYFPPGADGTVLDGFTVRRGSGNAPVGGILVQDADTILRGNVVADNETCQQCGGIGFSYSADRPVGRAEGNVIVGNDVLAGLRVACPAPEPPVPLPSATALCILGPAGVDLGVIASGNRIVDNAVGPAVAIEGRASIEHDVIDGNGGGLLLSGGPFSLFNVQVTRNAGTGIALDCAVTARVESSTIAGNGGRGIASAGDGLHVENAILWGNAEQVAPCMGTTPTVVSSLVEGGFAGGTGIVDADPLFVPGPRGDFYLAQVAAGQPATSPAVDAGSRTALAAGLDQRTTATDSAADAGVVDLGHHAERAAPLTILRGTMPDALAPYRTVDALPFVDDPGTLTDPALPLLFYRVTEATNPIGVTKEPATDSLRLDFLPATP